MDLTRQEKIPRIMVTMRCYENCKYCSTPYVKIDEVDGNHWIDLINNQDYKEVRFSGGEPLLYNDLFMIIDNIKIPYWIYTNLRFWMREYFELVDKNKCTFFASYHPKDKTDPSTFIEKAIEIHKNDFKIQAHYVDWDGYTEKEIEYIHRVKIEFDKIGIQFVANPDQQEVKLTAKHINCHIDRTLLGPDGNRYPCMKLLQEQQGNIALNHFEGIGCSRMDCMPCNADVIEKEKCWS